MVLRLEECRLNRSHLGRKKAQEAQGDPNSRARKRAGPHAEENRQTHEQECELSSWIASLLRFSQ